MRKMTAISSNCFTALLYDVIAPDFRPEDPGPLPHLFIVMEFVDSDLQKLMRYSSKVDFDEDHVKYILYNLLCGLNFLHSANVMHRDIKPANVLIDSECRVKLCDFGLARTRVDLPHDDLEEYVDAQMSQARPRKHSIQNAVLLKEEPVSGPEARYSDNDLVLPQISTTPKLRQTVDFGGSSGFQKEVTTPSRSRRRAIDPSAFESHRSALSTRYSTPNLKKEMSESKMRRKIISKRLLAERPKRETAKRSLSNHVQTRCYRAPEVILLEQHYDQAIDMWSVGCVLAQLLLRSANKEAAAASGDQHKPDDFSNFMSGNSCFPLSPGEHGDAGCSDSSVIRLSSQDQLLVILKTIGYQGEDDLSFLTDANAADYVNKIQNPLDQSTLDRLFPDTDPELVALLKGFLQFNPVMRLTAKDALKSKLFDSFRYSTLEQPSKKKITQKMNAAGVFDYEDSSQNKYRIQDYKKMLHREIKMVKKMRLLA